MSPSAKPASSVTSIDTGLILGALAGSSTGGVMRSRSGTGSLGEGLPP